MTTYRKLHGKAVKTVTTNPTDDAAEGQIWFNSTDNKFKSVVSSSAWVSAAAMITARGYGSANGTQTASLYTGGLEPGGTYYANTEEYNGSGWSVGGALPATNYAAGSAGTQTAALFFGGGNASGQVGTTYTYNGSSWTASPNSLNLTRDYICGTGTQTSALAYCGRVTSPSLAVVTNFEEWNGSSWTALTAAPTAVALSMGEGPETASFFASGGTNNGGPPYVGTAQEYNGSTLSTGGSVNTGRAAGGAAGNSSAGLIFGGDVGGSTQTKTETYDGTTFSEIADMSTAMRGVGNGSGATNAAAVVSGSYGPPALGTTEEFTSSSNVITAGAWAAGGSMSTARQSGSSFGTQTAAAVFCGETPSFTNNTEHYDGSSFSSGGNYPQSYATVGAFGVLTAGVGYGGRTPPSAAQNTTAEYDGSSWTAVNNYPIGIGASVGCGVLTAGLACAGDTFPPTSGRHSNTSKEYDGTNWTSGGNLGTAGYAGMAAGTQTAAVFVGGSNRNALTEEYDGSSWTAGGGSITNIAFGGSAGTQDNMTTFATNSVPYAFVQRYNGTAMSTDPFISTGRYAGTGAGTAPASLAMGGRAPPFSTAVEEFTAETTALNVKDLTQS
jgi:hypothetical protein